MVIFHSYVSHYQRLSAVDMEADLDARHTVPLMIQWTLGMWDVAMYIDGFGSGWDIDICGKIIDITLANPKMNHP